MIAYAELVERMEEAYTENSGCTPEAAGDTDIHFQVLAGEIYTLMGNLEVCRAALSPQTASGETLSKLAADRGVPRRAAQKAQGKLTFRNSATQIVSVFIPKGTVCKTEGEPSVRFLTLEDGTIPMNTVGTVEVAAEAEEPGPEGNVQAGTVTVLVSNVPLVAGVTNDAAFSGGCAEESDSALRARLLDTESHPSNGCNEGFYRALALQQPGVSSCYVTVDPDAANTVLVYLAAAGGAATTETVEAVQAVLDEARGINVKVVVKPAVEQSYSLQFSVVVKEGLDKEASKQACEQAVRTYMDELSIGQPPTWTGIAAALEATGTIQDIGMGGMPSLTLSGPQYIAKIASLTVVVR